jgi:hypothetical protein
MTEMPIKMQAAAFHGLATNLSLPASERLECALKALDIYEKLVDEQADAEQPVSIPLAELEALKERNRLQARELTALNEVLHQKNLELDAMHFVWCDGSCPGGVHRFTEGAQITEELIQRAERNVARLRSWYSGVEWRLVNYYTSLSDWHAAYIARAAAKTDLLNTEGDQPDDA